MSSLEDDVYEIEAIMGDRMNSGKRQYFIKWVGYPESDNTWEDEANIYSEELKREYEESKRTQKPRTAKFEPVMTNEWAKDIDRVLGVYKGDDGRLQVDYVTVDGKRASCSTDVIHIKAPIKLLEFYEKNLSFPE